MIDPVADSKATLWRATLAAVGIGVMGDAYLIWARHSATAFTRPALLLPLAAMGALLWMIAETCRRLRPTDRRTGLTCAALAGLVVAIAVLDLVPPVARDELTHHLAIPELYVRARRIIEIPFADQSYYPMLVDMLYTPLLQWLPDQIPKYLHLLLGLGGAAWIVLYLRRTLTAANAALGGLVFLTVPVVFDLAASAYVDLGLLFYATGALVALLLWSEESELRWLIASGLLAGFGASTKYNGLLILPLLAAGVVWLSPGDSSDRRRLSFAAVFVAMALLPMLPWLVKNLQETGNPLFPLFKGILGGHPLPSESGALDLLTKRRALYGESWLEIALIPLRIFVTGRLGDPARFDGVFNPVLLIAVIAAVRSRASRRDRFIALYAGLYVLLAFFLTTFRARYCLVIAAPLTILAVEQLARYQQAGGLSAMIARVAVAGGLLFSVFHFGLLWQGLDPLSFLSGRLSRDAYIARFVPEYRVLQFANRHLDPSARLYLLFLGSRSYYCERDFVYDFYYSGTMLRQCLGDCDDGAAVASCLRRERVSHLLWADELLVRYLEDNLTPAQISCWQSFASNHLQPLYRSGGFGLYALRGQ